MGNMGADVTDAEIFDTATESMGGRFPRELVDDPLRSVYDEIAERAKNLMASARRSIPELPAIHFDFIQDGKINAVAFKANGRYYLGITTGMLYMLRVVIGRMLSDSRTFGFVGEPDAEADDLPPFGDYAPDADLTCARDTPVLTPNDGVRAGYAWYLQDQAIMFLVGHELAHITRGHVDYLTREGAPGFSAPIGWLRTQARQVRFERKCLELDADQRSIASRIDSLRLMYQSHPRSLPPWSTTSYEAREILRDWAVSMGLVFRLFGDIRLSRSDLTRLVYPPIPLRRAWCEMNAYGVAQRTGDPGLAAAVREGLQEGRDYLEQGFATVLGEESRIEGLRAAVSDLGQDFMRKVVDHWNAELRAQLQPFSYEW